VNLEEGFRGVGSQATCDHEEYSPQSTVNSLKMIQDAGYKIQDTRSKKEYE
jgi:hypothetical protein